MDRAISDMDLLRYTQLANNESDTPSEYLRSQINELPDLRNIRALSDADRQRFETRLGPDRAVAERRLRTLSNEDLRNLMDGRIPSNENLDRAFSRLRPSEERDLRALSNADLDLLTRRLNQSESPKLYNIRLPDGQQTVLALTNKQVNEFMRNYPDGSISLLKTPQSTNQGIGSLRSPSPMP